MGCLRLTYRNETSPLRVSRDEEIDTPNWEVWISENTPNQHKECEDQQSGGSTFDNIQPGIDRAGDLGGFLVSIVETPFVIRSGELGMVGDMKNIPYSQAKRVLNQYTKGAVRGLRTVSRTAGVAGLVVGAGVSTYQLEMAKLLI